MKNEVAAADVRLATASDLHSSTYDFTAKDYFEIKKEGLKASTVKKFFWFIFTLILVSTVTPQLVSERNRQELAEEIRAQEKPDTNSKMDIPNIQNDDSKLNERRAFPAGSRTRQPVNKIKSPAP